jgi:hypothetical protein
LVFEGDTGTRTMTQERKIIRMAWGLLEVAKQLGSEPRCKIMSYSRDSFYRYNELYTKAARLASFLAAPRGSRLDSNEIFQAPILAGRR